MPNWIITEQERQYLLDLIAHAKNNGVIPGKHLISLSKNDEPKTIYKKITTIFSRKWQLPNKYQHKLPCNIVFDAQGTPYVYPSVVSDNHGAFGSYYQCQNLLTGEIAGVKIQRPSIFSISEVKKENSLLDKLGMLKGFNFKRINPFRYISYTFQTHLNGRTLNQYLCLENNFIYYTKKHYTKKYIVYKIKGKKSESIYVKYSDKEIERYISDDYAFLLAISAILHLKLIHDNRMIHRDISYNNIMISYDYSMSTIIDFGLALQLPQDKDYIKARPVVYGPHATPATRKIINRITNDSWLMRCINYLRGAYHYKFRQQDDIYALGVNLALRKIIGNLETSSNHTYKTLADKLKMMFSEDEKNQVKSLDHLISDINDLCAIKNSNTHSPQNFSATDKLFTFFINKREAIIKQENPEDTNTLTIQKWL